MFRLADYTNHSLLNTAPASLISLPPESLNLIITGMMNHGLVIELAERAQEWRKVEMNRNTLSELELEIIYKFILRPFERIQGDYELDNCLTFLAAILKITFDKLERYEKVPNWETRQANILDQIKKQLISSLPSNTRERITAIFNIMFDRRINCHNADNDPSWMNRIIMTDGLQAQTPKAGHSNHSGFFGTIQSQTLMDLDERVKTNNAWKIK